MESQLTDQSLIAACGLYCGNCKKYKTGKCPGCRLNEKATWCKIRTCCQTNEIANCSRCGQFSNPADCKIHNNFIGKIFSLLFGSDRNASIHYIKNHGADAYLNLMNEKSQMCIKRNQKIN